MLSGTCCTPLHLRHNNHWITLGDKSSSRRSLHTSGTGSQSSVSSRNSQFSLQNVTWEASKTSLFGISEQWILTWHILPTDVFWALLQRDSAFQLLERGKQLPSCECNILFHQDFNWKTKFPFINAEDDRRGDRSHFDPAESSMVLLLFSLPPPLDCPFVAWEWMLKLLLHHLS